MVDPVTSNVALAVPTRGSDTGTWDTPVNGNFTSIDSMFGGVTTLSLSSTALISLTSSQVYSSVIRLTGTLTATTFILLPITIFKSWTIDNQLLNSPSSFCAVLGSSPAGQGIGLPPSAYDVFYDGTNVKFKNLGRVGEYWDYASSAVPSWVSACTTPPYLNCNGTTFSSATYPVLANLLGTNTLPDSRGRVRASLSAGTARLTTVLADTVGSGGGDQNVQAHVHTNSLNDPGHTHVLQGGSGNQGLQSGTGGPVNIGGTGSGGTNVTLGISTNLTNITITNANFGTGASLNVQPTYLGGITLIRAA